MLSGWILSILLSIPAWFFYKWFLKKRISFVHRRYFLLSMLLLVFATPLTIKYVFGSTILPEILDKKSSTTDDLFMLEEVCISQVQTTGEEICNCSSVDYTNVFLYENNQWYDSIFYNAAWISPFLLFLFGIILFLLIGNIIYLNLLVKKFPKRRIIVNGESFWLLSVTDKITAGSFRLIDKYIILNEERLSVLNKQEQQAVLIHEIEHIKQHNTFELIGLSIIQLIWFVNPVFYAIKNELIEISEFIADAAVVQKAIMQNKDYALTLVRLKASQQQPLVSQFKSNQKETFKARISHLMESNIPKHSSSYFKGGLFTIAILFAVESWALFQPIEQEVNTIVLYHFVHKEHQENGKTAFCKTCVTKEYFCE